MLGKQERYAEHSILRVEVIQCCKREMLRYALHGALLQILPVGGRRNAGAFPKEPTEGGLVGKVQCVGNLGNGQGGVLQQHLASSSTASASHCTARLPVASRFRPSAWS
jgi:hypothetical protein